MTGPHYFTEWTGTPHYFMERNGTNGTEHHSAIQSNALTKYTKSAMKMATVYHVELRLYHDL